MKAVVLVGGEGTRLRPLTYTTPKQLLPVVEVPLLERALAHLARHGVDEAVLSLGYRPDAFLAAYPEGRAAGVRLEYAVEPEPLDTAGAVRFAAEEAGIRETFLVVNGDVLTDLDVTVLVEFHRSHGALATIALTPVDDPSRFGVVPTTPDGRVEAFLEKPPPGEAPTDLINAGTYVLEPEVVGRIPSARRVSIERETFPSLVADGALYALADKAYWLDTGTPEAYLRANADVLQGLRGTPPHPAATLVTEGVWALGSPEIAGTVVAASLLGARSRVARGAEVRASVVGPGAVVESGALVEDSVLLADAVVESGAVVRGTVAGRHSTVGERAIVEATSVLADRARVAPGAHLRDARVEAED